jgi:hypothetical protein
VPAIPVVLNLEMAYSEPVPINALKVRDICHVVSCIPDEHKNNYNEILMWPVCNRDNDDN